jgi:hypothetical protein
MKKIVTIMFFAGCSTVYAQHTSKKQLREYRNHPHWIKMMDDSTVNYREAVIAFDEFWKDKPEPEAFMRGGEEYGKEEEHERSFLQRIIKSDKKYKEEIVAYAEAYKRFGFWRMQNAAFVKEDGSIMTAAEQQKLIEQELLNRQSVLK